MALLDSADHAETPAPQRSRYTILAFALDPEPEVHHLHGSHEVQSWLQENWAEFGPASAIPFQLGWLGVWGYEDRASFFQADAGIVVDHLTGVWTLQRRGSEAQLEQWHAEVTAACLMDPLEPVPLELDDLRARDTHEHYLASVEQAKQEIYQGNSYEICLTTAVTARAQGDPFTAYLALRQASRAPFMQYLQFPSHADCPARVLLSASPERSFSITEHRMMRSEPIKGTRARAADMAEDEALRQDLLNHPKDRAENVMIADLVRNDLSVYAVPGSLRAERLCAVETYPTVHQMVSTITAQLAPQAHPAEAMAAAFPPGSMTGAPKISTMDILRNLETGPRGWYSGIAGYISTTGAADFSVLIRSAVLTRSVSQAQAECSNPASDSWDLHLGLGGAITADSDPEQEWQEVITKSRSVLGAWGYQFPESAPDGD